jgi:sugar (pentulose or hexulose) kinase
MAAGVYPDLATGVSRAVRFGRRIVPDAGSQAAYDERFQMYRRLCPTLIDLHRRL